METLEDNAEALLSEFSKSPILPPSALENAEKFLVFESPEEEALVSQLLGRNASFAINQSPQSHPNKPRTSTAHRKRTLQHIPLICNQKAKSPH